MCDSSFIKSATQHPLAQSNPTFRGWIFEADFLLQLRLADKGPPFIVTSIPDDKTQIWEVTNRFDFLDPSAISQKVRASNLSWKSGIWFLPERWNQGCYDALCLTDSFGVRFIQVTCAKTHKVKLKYLIYKRNKAQGLRCRKPSL